MFWSTNLSVCLSLAPSWKIVHFSTVYCRLLITQLANPMLEVEPTGHYGGGGRGRHFAAFSVVPCCITCFYQLRCDCLLTRWLGYLPDLDCCCWLRLRFSCLLLHASCAASVSAVSALVMMVLQQRKLDDVCSCHTRVPLSWLLSCLKSIER